MDLIDTLFTSLLVILAERGYSRIFYRISTLEPVGSRHECKTCLEDIYAEGACEHTQRRRNIVHEIHQVYDHRGSAEAHQESLNRNRIDLSRDTDLPPPYSLALGGC
jgi:hypothetical protein